MVEVSNRFGGPYEVRNSSTSARSAGIRFAISSQGSQGPQLLRRGHRALQEGRQSPPRDGPDHARDRRGHRSPRRLADIWKRQGHNRGGNLRWITSRYEGRHDGLSQTTLLYCVLPADFNMRPLRRHALRDQPLDVSVLVGGRAWPRAFRMYSFARPLPRTPGYLQIVGNFWHVAPPLYGYELNEVNELSPYCGHLYSFRLRLSHVGKHHTSSK